MLGWVILKNPFFFQPCTKEQFVTFFKLSKKMAPSDPSLGGLDTCNFRFLKQISFKTCLFFYSYKEQQKTYSKGTMHEHEHKESSTFLRWIQDFFCFKYRPMSFKEEPQKEKLSLPFIFWKKINFHSNCWYSCDLCENVFN